MINKQTRKQSESGNVLFLILIAVALFAALSYVVTQSTRSGGGSTEREKNILSSAQMTQYPTALRTSIIRMVLGGVGVESIRFNPPGSFGASTNLEVFHPSGGGAGYQQAPADLSATGSTQLLWSYNANFYVPGIGIDTSGGNDLVAFLPGVSAGVCKQTNEELGIVTTNCTLNSGVPVADSAVVKADVEENMDASYSFPGGPGIELQGADSGGTCAAFSRQASGCFYNTDGSQYVFYSVLLER